MVSHDMKNLERKKKPAQKIEAGKKVVHPRIILVVYLSG
jgi:hypothetical protein